MRAVEISCVAGQARIDVVGDLVREAAPVQRRRHSVLARDQLGLSIDVIQSELDRQRRRVGGLGNEDLADHEGLRLDPGNRPVSEGRRQGDVEIALDERRLVDQRERSGGREVGAKHIAKVARDLDGSGTCCAEFGGWRCASARILRRQPEP
jgi:hypothetical protein